MFGFTSLKEVAVNLGTAVQ